MRDEIESIVQQRIERVLSRLNLVTREEFEVVKELAAKARQEQEALQKRLNEIDKELRKK